MLEIIIIRSEELRDYNSIAALHAQTFTYCHGMGEVPLISVLRNRSGFDPSLSLVAEHHGKIVGHGLFTPKQVIVKGELLNAVLLAPLAVHPEFQRQGIGSRIMDEGHHLAQAKGYDLSLLLGHPKYYTRFGYQTKMWGTSHIQVKFTDIPYVNRTIEERRIEIGDLKTLYSMWERWFSESDLAVKPGTSILDWISYGSGIRASAITVDGELSGYIRYAVKNPQRIISFLSLDEESFQAMCFLMKNKICEEDEDIDHLSLPIHPNTPGIVQFVNIPFRSKIKVGEASMIKILSFDNASIVRYCDEVASEILTPGSVIWPVEFDVL